MLEPEETKSTPEEIQNRRILKRREPKKSPAKVQREFVLTDPEAIELYESLLHVFSSRDHLIVGRDDEGIAIRQFIDSNLSRDVSGLLYICGHPGQGKTAVVNQVLFDYFGDLDSCFGGTCDEVFILKYNGMRYETPHGFIESLLADLKTLGEMGRPRRTNLHSLASQFASQFKGAVPAERLTSKKKSEKKKPKKRAKTTDAEVKEPVSVVPTDIDELSR